jgi:methylaspartate ammonia-lyase
MKIKKIITSIGYSGYFFDDKEAIKKGAKVDGEFYSGKTYTNNFTQVRMPGKSLSIMIEIENGLIAIGDCAAVQYSGGSGRDSLFKPEEHIAFIQEKINPFFLGEELDSFKKLAEKLEQIKGVHTAVRYGFSQALLNAVALSKNKTGAKIIMEEYSLKRKNNKIRVFCQSGDNRYDNVDKMIIKRVDSLPHALINTVEKLGKKGENFLKYVSWVTNRIKSVKDSSYKPTLHFDVYGTIGMIFSVYENKEDLFFTSSDGIQINIYKIIKYIKKTRELTQPFDLYLEGVVELKSREDTLNCFKIIKDELKNKKIDVKLVADEWCNTLEDIKVFADAKACDMIQIKTPDLGGIQNIVEAVIYCKEKGVEAYVGGTCNETDISARTCIQIVVATEPVQTLAKPGMGVDEGFLICKNEINRTEKILEIEK